MSFEKIKPVRIIHRHSKPQRVIQGHDLTDDIVEYAERNRKDFIFEYADEVVPSQLEDNVELNVPVASKTLAEQHNELADQLSRYTHEYLGELSPKELLALCLSLTGEKVKSPDEAIELIIGYRDKGIAAAKAFAGA